jgi:outer membrane murein-binding lipoprotein Lpp
MRGTIALAAVFGLVSLGGCISSSGEVPEWFEQRSAANDSSYPSLRDVPRSTTANTDANHWEAVEADLLAAGQAVKTNPRAQPATTVEDPNAFVEQARQDLEATRQSHEP